MKPSLTCPVCGRRLEGAVEKWPYLPFCGKKCRTIDLGRWLAGENNLPPVEPDEPIEDE